MIQIFPAKRITVGDRALWDMRVLKEVVIPDGVERIGCYWFTDTDIISVYVPKDVREIQREAFYSCKNLRQVTFAEGSMLEKICESSFDGSGLESIEFPVGVNEIGDHAFSLCKNLKTASFPKNSRLERIGASCFYGTGLQTFVFPSEVWDIGSSAFSQCH